MKSKFISSLTLCFVLLTSLSIHAATKTPKPFTQKEMKRFIKDWPAFATWASKQDTKYANIKDPNVLFGITYQKEFQTFLKKRGWKGERFFYVALHSAAGLMTLALKNVHPQVSSQMSQQMEAIQNNPMISDEQKQQMMAAMQQAQGELKNAHTQIDIPKQELKIIKQHRKQLEKIFDIPANPSLPQ